MRYTAFLLFGLLLIMLQGELYLLLGPLAANGYRPSLLVPLLVFMGVTETNLSLGALVAFVLGYVLDLVGGAPIGLYTFTSVATLAFARVTGLRILTQGWIARAFLAGIFDVLGSIIALILLAIFLSQPYVPRAMFSLVLPHGLATALVAPLVFRMSSKMEAWLANFLDPSRARINTSLAAHPSPTEPNDIEHRR